MSETIEHPEYNSSDNPYPSFGKKYNGERGVISLTSWRARLKTCGQTIFSLIKQCPGFHIVLVLSEEEFPKKMNALPEDLVLFADNELIEILWVKKNCKAFKKILFTMDKYRTVPIISADDDCVYKYNYANELYQEWLKHKSDIVSYKNCRRYYVNTTWGCATLYPPYYFKEYGLRYLTDKIVSIGYDDNYYVVLRRRLDLQGTTYIHKPIKTVISFINEIKPLSDEYTNGNLHNRAYRIMDYLIEQESNKQHK